MQLLSTYGCIKAYPPECINSPRHPCSMKFPSPYIYIYNINWDIYIPDVNPLMNNNPGGNIITFGGAPFPMAFNPLYV